MAIIATPFLHLSPYFLKPSSTPRRNRFSIFPPLRFSLQDRDGRKLYQISSSQSEVQDSDVWKLFKEAQQNILYLNKQRLMAMEELNKANKDIQTLKKTIENLESDKCGDSAQDKSSVLWELLLRIDSMVLTGAVDRKDASSFRRLILDCKVRFPDVFTSLLQKTDAELLEGLRRLSEQTRRSGFHIIHICTEMDPVVSVGALGSYVTGLSRGLQRKGNLVEVILPKYKTMDLSEIQGLQEIKAEVYSYFNGQLHANKIWTGVVYGIGVILIQPVHFSSFFNRDMVYGYSDDFERFTYFSRASLDYLVKSGNRPDILHIHNWETAIVGPLFWDIFVHQGLAATKIVLTCQDFDWQCLAPPEKLELCGLNPSRLNRQDRLQDNTETHLVNPLKGGIVYSNKAVIMSSIYSKGGIIRSLGHGSRGLELTISSHKDKLVAAPYGFEKSTWNPSTDHLLPENYSVNNMKGKTVCKGALQQHIGFSEDDSFILVSCIFSEISVVDLENLMGVLQLISSRKIQFLIMGESRIPSINSVLISLQQELKQDQNVRFINKYDEASSHLILAGSDLILCHSYEDPVLQVPFKAITYGAPPILVTTQEKRFRYFMEPDSGSSKFAQCVSIFSNVSLLQAVDEIRNEPSEWNRKLKEVMSKDLSWDAECSDVHISVYESLKNL